MANVPVPSIVTATPDGDDTVLGVKDGLVKRFTLDNVGAGINFSDINATTNMAFNTAGTERMRLDSAGNVGIGTSSPSTYSAKLVTAGAFGSSTPAVSLVNTSAENAGNIAETQYWLANSFSGLVNVAKIGAVTGTTGNQYGSLYFSTSNAGAPVERMRLDSAGNLAMTGGGVVDAASFRDYSNTAYYLDPANTGTSLNVAGAVIQGVSTTAPTLSANNTLTFSIVDDTTLRISVRGSDGTTRTATITLT